MADVAALQRQHPEWRIVDAIDQPGGGVWAVGADGGVFSLDAGGNPGGGAYFGSLPGLGAALGDPAVHGQAVRIEADPQTGGYTIVNSRGERYNFAGNQRPADTTVAPPPPAAPPPNSDAELNTLRASLNSRGLGNLLDQAWNYYKGAGGGNVDATVEFVRTTPEYQARFPNRPASWSEAQYMNYEEQIRYAATQYGVPPDFVDQEDIGKMLAGNVSAAEGVDRIKLASQAARSDQATLSWMRDNFGIEPDLGAVTAFYLDTTPGGKGESFLDRQQQFAQAQIGGAAASVGFGNLSAAEAERVRQAGLSPDQARGAFGQVAMLHPLFEETVTESMQGSDLGQTEGIGLVTGEAGAQEAVAKRRQARQAQFGGGGGAAQGGRGGSGLGTSQG